MSRFKRIAVVAASLIVILVVLGGIKALQIHKMVAQAAELRPPPETVTTSTATTTRWQSMLTSVGSLVAVEGVTVSAEVPGKVVRIAFKPGSQIRAGQLLVVQDTSSERAQLRAAEARLALARTTLDRVSRLLARKVIAVSQHDDARAQVEQAAADVDVVRATIRKKTIHAPFAGRLGIRLVNLGQVIASGTPIVSLQSVDPIFVNFSLPQQQLAQVQPGLVVRLKTNVVKDEISGTITAINPQVDASTRNVGLQATVSNPGERLRPGMFVDVTVMLQQQREVLAIPATAVLHAPYGDSVFVVRPAKQRAGGADHPTVHRQFVRLGERRGDFVAVHSGVQKGNQVVSSGVFKLRNDQPVVVDNKLSLRFRLAPAPSDG